MDRSKESNDRIDLDITATDFREQALREKLTKLKKCYTKVPDGKREEVKKKI